MIDHLGLRVSDFEASKTFYIVALAPLGYVLATESASGAGFGKGSRPDFWIKRGKSIHFPPPGKSLQSAGCGGPAIHVAFACEDRSQVDAFHRDATAAGGLSNGAPGLRPDHHPNYYSAYVFDPDGYNLEAVCHQNLTHE